jgi:hypothetical protein
MGDFAAHALCLPTVCVPASKSDETELWINNPAVSLSPELQTPISELRTPISKLPSPNSELRTHLTVRSTAAISDRIWIPN